MKHSNKNYYVGVIAILVIIGSFSVSFFTLWNFFHEPKNASAQGGTTSNAGVAHYKSNKYSFRFSFPESLLASSTFNSTYVAGEGWNLYTNSSNMESGEKAVSFVKTGSNEIFDAELRIGVSDNPKDVLHCTKPPAGTTGEQVKLNGNDATKFTVKDGATMHSLEATSYRIVHNDECYAIDEILMSGNPNAYTPPRSLPFTKEEATTDLNVILSTFTFSK